LAQADLDITEINKLTAEATRTPLKLAKSEYFSKPLVEVRERRPSVVGWLLGEASLEESLPSNAWSSVSKIQKFDFVLCIQLII